MKVLISLGYLRAGQNAGAGIALSIGRAMRRLNDECHVFCYTFDNSPIKEIEESGLKVHSVPKYGGGEIVRSFTRNIAGSKSTAEKLKHYLCFILRHPVISIKLTCNKFAYTGMLAKVIKREKIDAILCVTYPFPECRRVLNMPFRKCPAYVLLQDSYGLINAGDKAAMKQELHAFRRAEHIFAIPSIYRAFKELHISVLTQKMSIVHHAAIIKPASHAESNETVFDGNHVNIVFAGRLRDAVRNPAYIYQVLAKVFEIKEDIRVYILGHLESPVTCEFAAQYPDRFFLLGNLPRESAYAVLEKADFLLNIGNGTRFDCQIPSKIMDYFSTGKPIISTSKSTHCPTLPYFDKYANSIVLLETEEVDVAACRLISFLTANRGVLTPFDEVENIFRVATPYYVANYIHNTIQKSFSR